MAKSSRRRRSRSRSSTPRSERRRRSRERERGRRRRYSSSSDSDSSSDYDRRSRRQDSSRRRGRSRSRSRSRERRRRVERREDSPKRRSPVRKEESKVSDVAKEIPGYKDMTPAERIKARTKIMLERAAARSQGSREGMTEGVANVPDQPPPPLPSEAQLEAVEDEDFAPQRFKSRRTVKKQEPASASETEPTEIPDDVLSKSHEEAMFGSQLPPKPSEPTLASLGIQIIDPVASIATFTGKRTNKIETEEERNIRWIEKLKQLRSTHKPSSISRH